MPSACLRPRRASFEGRGQTEGSKLCASLLQFAPVVNQFPTELKRAEGALQAWRKRAPQQARMPPPEPIVQALAGALRSRGLPVTAFAFMTQLDTHRRPGESGQVLRHAQPLQRRWPLSALPAPGVGGDARQDRRA